MNTTDFTTTISAGDLQADISTLKTGHAELKEVDERIYNENDVNDFLENKTYYLYDPVTLKPSAIWTLKSNFEYSTTNIEFSYEYATKYGGIYQILSNNNVLGEPITIEKGFLTRSNDLLPFHWYHMEKTAIEYVSTLNGNIKPYKTLLGRNIVASDNAIIYEHPNSPNNSPLFRTTQTSIYNNEGILIGATDEGNHVVNNIYDYDSKFITAFVINATPSDQSSYTSFETSELGGWSLINPNSNSVVINNDNVTGKRAFNLKGTCSLYAVIGTPSKKYIVSFWANNSNVLINNHSASVKSAHPFNGFSYYEYEVPAGTANVDVTGDAIIDELRLYPFTARMRTVTYDPIIGKTSECDENNKITSYEYDESGRLRFIKDESKNVTKMYEYNQTKPQGCPRIVCE